MCHPYPTRTLEHPPRPWAVWFFCSLTSPLVRVRLSIQTCVFGESTNKFPQLADLIPHRLRMSGNTPWRRASRSTGPVSYRRSCPAAPATSRRVEHGPPLPQPNRAQTQSCRQLLQQRLQKYQWAANFHVEGDGPQHNQRWRGAFTIGEVTIGVSGWHTRKDMAKEEAASSSLNWLNQYGYH